MWITSNLVHGNKYSDFVNARVTVEYQGESRYNVIIST